VLETVTVIVIPEHSINILTQTMTKQKGHSAVQRVLVFLMQKYAVYWPEGGAASPYSVFIGQKMSLTGYMREDRNFKASNVSGSSVWIFIL
jgi:hypothetical protein